MLNYCSSGLKWFELEWQSYASEGIIFKKVVTVQLINEVVEKGSATGGRKVRLGCCTSRGK